jgi:hypothetical protein
MITIECVPWKRNQAARSRGVDMVVVVRASPTSVPDLGQQTVYAARR